VLLVDGDAADGILLSRTLPAQGPRRFEVFRVGCLTDALEELATRRPDIVALALSFIDASGREAFESIRDAAPDVPIVILAGDRGSDITPELLQEGAQDYIYKREIEPRTLLRCFEYAIERMRAARQLEAARQAAEDASRAKGAFVAAMSHEIRTPLNAILGMADLLLETSLNDEQEEYVRIFQRSGRSLLALLDNVLELSRVESGRLRIESEPFDLIDLLEDVTEAFALSAHRKQLSLVLDVHPELPLRVVGDAGRVKQVLMNLIGNAIKFTESGDILLRARPEPIGIQLELIDTGIGIPQDKQNLVFERFEQVNRDADTARGGSGLGLALCRELVEALGGRIGVDSRPGEGSCFRIILPLEASGNDAASVGWTRRAELIGERALLFMKDGIESSVLSDQLTYLGLEVEAARSCDEARRALETRPGFRVALLDASLDRTTGFAEQIAATATLAQRVCLLLPMDHRVGDFARCRAAGVCPLLKPVRRDILLQTLGISVPREASAAAEPSRVEVGSFPGRILLVDDPEDNRALTLAFLRRSGSEIDIAEHGAAALARVEQEQFDLILMDMQMPIMDGYEATRRIRALEAESGRPRVPIIALTAYAFREQGARCLEAGCDAHVAKPVDKRTLLDTIRTCAEEVRIDPDAEIADLLPQYLVHRRADVDALWKAIADGDWPLVSRIGHNMKGTGKGYGLPRISEIGARLEASGRASDRREITLALSALESFLARVAHRGGEREMPVVSDPRLPSG
jgi:signal transduction histidine kinase